MVDPGFPRGGGANPKGGQPIIWLIFSENCMRMKIFWAKGGRGRPLHPLDPPLMTQYITQYALADLGGREGRAPPAKCLHFHAVLGKIGQMGGLVPPQGYEKLHKASQAFRLTAKLVE